MPFSCKHTCLYFGVRTLSNAPPPHVEVKCWKDKKYLRKFKTKTTFDFSFLTLSSMPTKYILVTISPYCKSSIDPNWPSYTCLGLQPSAIQIIWQQFIIAEKLIKIIWQQFIIAEKLIKVIWQQFIIAKKLLKIIWQQFIIAEKLLKITWQQFIIAEKLLTKCQINSRQFRCTSQM